MATHPILRQLELALAHSGGSERIFRLECADVIAEYDRRNAKIESDAKVIAALREKLKLMDDYYQTGGALMSHMAHMAQDALAVIEQTIGEK